MFFLLLSNDIAKAGYEREREAWLFRLFMRTSVVQNIRLRLQKKTVKNDKIKALRLHDPQRKKLSLSLGLDILHCLKNNFLKKLSMK